MAKSNEVQATWVEMDVDAMSQGEQAAYQSYKALQRKAAEQRTAFEQLMNENARDAGLPEGKKLVFGYRFGKLSAAIVDDDGKGKVKAATPAKLSLSDFMAMQVAQGKRT